MEGMGRIVHVLRGTAQVSGNLAGAVRDCTRKYELATPRRGSIRGTQHGFQLLTFPSAVVNLISRQL